MANAEAFRIAAQAVSTASLTPGYRFREDQLVGAFDGRGGREEALLGFREVATALQRMLIKTGPAPETTLGGTYPPGGEVEAINDVIEFCCTILDQLGGDPNAHVNALLRERNVTN